MAAATTTTIIGTTRSRTDRFLKYRAAAARGNGQGSSGGYGMYGSSNGAGEAGNGASASMAASRLLDAALGPPSDAAETGQATSSSTSSLPPAPAYVAFKDAARRDMARIRAAMAELRELHSRAALVTFDADDARSREAEVSRATAEVTRLFRNCEARLSAVGREGYSGGLTEADERVRQNVRRTLAAELQQLSLQFRRQQRGFLEKLRAGAGGGGGPSSSSFSSSSTKAGGFDALLEGASRRGGGGGGGNNADDDYDDGSAPYVSTTSGFTQKQQQRAGALDSLAREREAEISRVVESISQLSEIMKDLGEISRVFFSFQKKKRKETRRRRGKKNSFFHFFSFPSTSTFNNRHTQASSSWSRGASWTASTSTSRRWPRRWTTVRRESC